MNLLVPQPITKALISPHFPISINNYFFKYFSLICFLYILKMAGGRPSGTTGSAQVLPTPPHTTVLKPFRSMLPSTHYNKRQNTERSESRATADKHDFLNIYSQQA